VASHWIDGGRAETLLHWLRREVAARYGIAREKLAGLDWHGHEAAFHVMLKLPAPWHSDDFTAAARMAGITVQPISSFTVGVGALVEAVRVTLTQVSDHETLGQALATLRNILERGPSRPRAVI
ncbi:MAG: PLP-dependent aminotransferase family protein, partial [Rhodospirillaceae bacterium]|nr:PLP-dependent aminotransferase family protein [Rhodospirillaceae bacterium]